MKLVGLAAGLAASVLLPGCTLPTLPGDLVVGQFTGADGNQIVLSYSKSTNTTFLSAPGSIYGPLALRSLRGVANTTVAGTAISGGRLILLVHGSAPDCPHRNVILSNRMPGTAQLTIPGCDKTYSLAGRPLGDVVVMQTDVVAPSYYVFRDTILYGPQQQAGSVRTAGTPTTRPNAARPVTRAATAASPLDLDSLPLPSRRQGVDLDR